MCTAITLEEKTIDIVIDALAKKMSSINTAAILSGVRTDKMAEDYAQCEKALDLFNKAKDSFSAAKTMAAEKM